MINEKLPANTADEGRVNKILTQLILKGDLSILTDEEKMLYAKQVADAAGVSLLMRPFDFIEAKIAGKSTVKLYANKNCAEQIRQKYNVNISIDDPKKLDDMLIIRGRATMLMPDGSTRFEEDIVPIEIEKIPYGKSEFMPIKGVELANAVMKATTKLKRRLTFSIIGLGIMGIDDLEDIRNEERNRAAYGNKVITPSQQQPSKQLPDSLATPDQINQLNKIMNSGYFSQEEIEKYNQNLSGLTAKQAEIGIKKKFAILEERRLTAEQQMVEEVAYSEVESASDAPFDKFNDFFNK